MHSALLFILRFEKYMFSDDNLTLFCQGFVHVEMLVVKCSGFYY